MVYSGDDDGPYLYAVSAFSLLVSSFLLCFVLEVYLFLNKNKIAVALRGNIKITFPPILAINFYKSTSVFFIPEERYPK